MPLTPFIGLSVFIHIILIIIFKIFHINPYNWNRKKRYSVINFWLSSIIIVTMFSFVLFSAGVLVHASIVEKHSNIIFIKNHLTLWSSFINSNLNILKISLIQILS